MVYKTVPGFHCLDKKFQPHILEVQAPTLALKYYTRMELITATKKVYKTVPGFHCLDKEFQPQILEVQVPTLALKY